MVSESPCIWKIFIAKRYISSFSLGGSLFFFAIVDLYYFLRRIDFLPNPVEIYVSDFNFAIHPPVAMNTTSFATAISPLLPTSFTNKVTYAEVTPMVRSAAAAAFRCTMVVKK